MKLPRSDCKIKQSNKHIFFKKISTVFWSSLRKFLKNHKLKSDLKIFTEREKDVLTAAQTSESHLACVMTFR